MTNARKERKSRVLDYFASQQQGEPEEETDPFEGLDESFGLTNSGKE